MKIEMSDILKDPNSLYTNGLLTFYSTAKGIKTDIVSREDIEDKVNKIFNNEDFSQEFKNNVAKGLIKYQIKGSLIDGFTFLEKIEKGECFRNSGKIEKIIVSGYISNLGVYCKTDEGKYCNSEGFTVDLEMFKRICKKYPVRVDWVEEKDNGIIME